MQLVWLTIGIIALFSVVMSVGIVSRKSRMARNLRISAADARTALADSRAQCDEILFGVRQDRSMTEVEMIVRDASDDEVGRIIYRPATRAGAITISTGADTFTVDVLPTWSQRMVLHRANDGSHVLCTFDRARWGAHRFEAAGVGSIQSRRCHRLGLAPTSDITLNGVLVGASRHLGGAVDRGVALMLPTSIPLYVRMFVLALQ